MFMSEDPRLADAAKARADLASTPTNPADNDFHGLCIQCLNTKAILLVLFKGIQPTSCNAFCSFDCAERFAFELANIEDPTDVVESCGCPHFVPDGKYCRKCHDEYMIAARAAQKGGAA